MANTDIRLSLGFFRDIKVRRLQRMHGDSGVIGLLKLWLFAAEHRCSGTLVDVGDEEIELITDMDFLDTLLKLNLVERVPGNFLRIVNWEKHQKWVMDAPARSAKARKAATERWNKKLQSGVSKNGQ